MSSLISGQCPVMKSSESLPGIKHDTNAHKELITILLVEAFTLFDSVLDQHFVAVEMVKLAYPLILRDAVLAQAPILM